MSGGVEVVGLKEFRRLLREIDSRWDAAFSLAHQRIGTTAAGWARTRAGQIGGVQDKAKSAIGERHSAKSAAVAVLPSAVDRMANVAFWGAKRHSGWYANPRYSNSRPQHPKWVTASWEAAVRGQGPYAINDALADHLHDIDDMYLDAVDRIAKQAFPEDGSAPVVPAQTSAPRRTTVQAFGQDSASNRWRT